MVKMRKRRYTIENECEKVSKETQLQTPVRIPAFTAQDQNLSNTFLRHFPGNRRKKSITELAVSWMFVSLSSRKQFDTRERVLHSPLRTD